MKYLDWCMVLMMIMVMINVFNFFGFLPQATNSSQPLIVLESSMAIDEDGKPIDPDSFAYKVYYFNVGQEVLNSGSQDTSQLYMVSNGDFLKGLWYFISIFVGGTTLVFPLLNAFHVPQALHIVILLPIMFLYAIAFIQLISGRSFSLNE